MKKLFITVLLFIFLPFVSSRASDNLANCPGSEMGDVVFRPMLIDLEFMAWKCGHVALYRNSDSGHREWKPKEEGVWLVSEVYKFTTY